MVAVIGEQETNRDDNNNNVVTVHMETGESSRSNVKIAINYDDND